MTNQFIVIHGFADTGKTTTLRHVVESLTGIKLPMKPQNWRVVFSYHGLTIALSTFGDKPKDIQAAIRIINSNNISIMEL